MAIFSDKAWSYGIHPISRKIFPLNLATGHAFGTADQPLVVYRSMHGVKKQHLPQKTCTACGRPFVWRKKWARDWDQVRWCSDACRRAKTRATG